MELRGPLDTTPLFPSLLPPLSGGFLTFSVCQPYRNALQAGETRRSVV